MPFLMWEWTQAEDFSENGNKPVNVVCLVPTNIKWQDSYTYLLQSYVSLGDFFANYWLQ